MHAFKQLEYGHTFRKEDIRVHISLLELRKNTLLSFTILYDIKKYIYEPI
jgi:hypothetical protein